MSETRGLVAYCDGGANPNPNGPSGSGIHAYTYHLPVGKEKPTRVDGWVATDSGYLPKNDFDSGRYVGVVIDSIIEIAESIGYGTNNLAEMNAVLRTLEHAMKLEHLSRVHTICDSEYTLKGMNEWVPGWKRNNWLKSDGLPPANLSVWKNIDQLIQDAATRFEYTNSWVRGHNKNYGNEKADYLASIAVNRSYRGVLLLEEKTWPANEYFAKLEGIHPFLSLKRVYFNTNAEFHQPGIYYQTDGSGKDYITGKRSSEATYSVVCTFTPDVLIEAAIQATVTRPSEFNRIVYGKLDILRGQDVMLFAKNWGQDAYIHDRRNMNLNTPDRRPVVVEVRADELPLRTFDALSFIEDILVEFQNNYLVNSEFYPDHARQFELFDVTDHFYSTRVKKSGKDEIEVHELKKDFGVGCVNTKIKVDHSKLGEMNLVLSFGEDIPPRNSFKHFELLNPVVYVVAWKDSDHLVRYGTIVKTDDAVGIWSNYFANNFLLKK